MILDFSPIEKKRCYLLSCIRSGLFYLQGQLNPYTEALSDRRRYGGNASPPMQSPEKKKN